MKILTLLSFLVFVNTAHSFDTNSIKNIFKSLLDAEPKVEQKNAQCCDPTAEEVEQINQCAIDLCGNSGTVDSAYVSDKDYQGFYKDEGLLKDYEEFKPKLKKYLDTVRAKTRSEVEEIKVKSQATNSDYYKLDSYTDDQISSIMSDELASNIQVEIKKDRQGNKKVDVKVLPSEIPFDEELKNKYVEYKTNEMKTSFSTGVHSGYLELDVAMTFVKSALDKHLAEVEKKIGDTPAENTTDLDALKKKKEQYAAIGKKINETKELTESSVTEFYYSIQYVDYQITGSLNLAYYDATYEDFKCGELKCKEYLAKKIPSLMTQKNLQEIIKQTSDDKKANELINTCEYYWHEERLKKAKEGKKQEFIDSMPEILNRVKTNFSSKFSPESANKLDKYFTSLKTYVADDPLPDESDYNPLEYLKEEVLRVAEPEEDESTESDEEELKGVLADYKKVKKHIMMGEVAFEHALTSCEDADVMAGDHFLPSEIDAETYIHVSSFSCNHYTTGKQVFAHELGHAISGQFLHQKTSVSSLAKYKGHRDCISGNYKDKDFAGAPMWKDFSHEGDTKYSEEDMADFVASVIYANPNERLLSCALIAKDKNNVDFNRKELSVLNKITFDTHSSPFLRTLKEAISKDRVLTPSCRQIIEKYQDRINFNKCGF